MRASLSIVQSKTNFFKLEINNMHVFISYASNDKVKVTRLVRELQDQGISVWFDEDQVLPGDDLLQKMANGIHMCRRYIICLSPSFDKRPPQSWVKHEFRLAMLKERNESTNIVIPVRIKTGGGIPSEIGLRAFADLTTTKRWDKNINKLIQSLGPNNA